MDWRKSYRPSPRARQKVSFIFCFPLQTYIYIKYIYTLLALPIRFYIAESRTQNRESLIAEIDKLNATDPENPITHVINAAGVTG